MRHPLTVQDVTAPPSPSERLSPLQLGQLRVDRVTFEQALDAIEALVHRGTGGLVVTPNVDHVVIAERDLAFRAAYAAADLSLADGMPVVWASRLLGAPVPEKISGSDLIEPLVRRAAERRWRVFLVGAGPGVAEEAATRLARDMGVNVVGTFAPRIRLDGGADDTAETVRKIREARPDLLLVAFGAPKQEVWSHRYRTELGPVVTVGIGASLDFLAGRIRRAPRWVSRSGLEWLWRLVREPRRLWRRYLVQDPAFLRIVWRQFCARPS